MAIAKITKAKKSKRLIKYLLNEKKKVDHDDLDARVLHMSSQNVDVSVFDAERIDAQYQALRELSEKADKEQQIFHIIQSFASDEFDYRDSAQVARANELGKQLAQKVAGEQAQALIVTQADNANAIVHNHIVISAVLLNEKSLQTNNVSVKNIREKNDQVLRDNFMKQHENVVNSSVRGRKTIAEQEINARGELTKKDVMREKLNDAMSKATSVEEFEELLKENDVELIRGKRKKQEIFKYRDVDESRAMTDRALGESYSIDAVLEQIQANAARVKREKEEEEEREKEKKKRELEDSVSENNKSESDDFEDVRSTQSQDSLDALFEKAKHVRTLDSKSSAYTDSRIQTNSNDFDLEL